MTAPKNSSMPRLLTGLLLLGLLCPALGPSALAQDKGATGEAATGGAATANRLQELVKQARRVVCLGDSITAAGQYVTAFEVWLQTRDWPQRPVVIDAGLPSETVSGLSEEGHAGGQFPRPALSERLERVLKVTQPDLVIACYGMNCGIYQPFDPERFRRYQDGIRQLHKAVQGVGAQLILLTPPFYDDRRSPREFRYNDVLQRYGDWLVQQREAGWNVIDVHSAMTAEVARRRETQPDFTFQPDGVHPNDEGHWFIASRLIAGLGDGPSAQAASPRALLEARGLPVAMLPLLQQRTALLRDAYVHAAGHKRPGVNPGRPLPEALETAKQLEVKIAELRGK